MVQTTTAELVIIITTKPGRTVFLAATTVLGVGPVAQRPGPIRSRAMHHGMETAGVAVPGAVEVRGAAEAPGVEIDLGVAVARGAAHLGVVVAHPGVAARLGHLVQVPGVVRRGTRACAPGVEHPAGTRLPVSHHLVPLLVVFRPFET